jgi:hypothetical protein
MFKSIHIVWFLYVGFLIPEIPIKTPGLLSIQVFFVTKTKTLCEDLHHLVTTKKSAKGGKRCTKLSPEYDEKMLFYDEKNCLNEVKTL